MPAVTTVINHPLINDRLTQMRDRNCSSSDFRHHLHDISALMIPTVTADLKTREISVETPLETMQAPVLAKPITLVPILRAGLALADAFQTILSEAAVAHIGMARNEDSLQPETYYFNCPSKLNESEIIVLDPMLATGGSAAATLTALKEKGAEHLRFACLLAAPEGLEHLQNTHPDVPLYTAAEDRQLNDKGYILPGLGDAGDRVFGTL